MFTLLSASEPLDKRGINVCLERVSLTEISYDRQSLDKFTLGFGRYSENYRKSERAVSDGSDTYDYIQMAYLGIYNEIMQSGTEDERALVEEEVINARKEIDDFIENAVTDGPTIDVGEVDEVARAREEMDRAEQDYNNARNELREANDANARAEAETNAASADANNKVSNANGLATTATNWDNFSDMEPGSSAPVQDPDTGERIGTVTKNGDGSLTYTNDSDGKQTTMSSKDDANNKTSEAISDAQDARDRLDTAVQNEKDASDRAKEAQDKYNEANNAYQEAREAFNEKQSEAASDALSDFGE